MKFETFQKRYNEGIYKIGDKFWVCDVIPNPKNPIGEYQRKLQPTKVICLSKETKKGEEIYFVKAKKDGTPSKSTVSIYGPVLNAKPFDIFETEIDAKDCYTHQLKDTFLKIDKQFDAFKATCELVLGNILNELKKYEGIQ